MSKTLPKSELLIDSNDLLIVQTALAEAVGDRQAIALQQIHYWMQINQKADKETHFFDDHWWVFNTWQEWKDENFRFWSLNTTRRVFDSLESDALIVMRPHEKQNKGKWVTINYMQLELMMRQKGITPRLRKLAERRQKRAASLSKSTGQPAEIHRGSAQIGQAVSNTETTETTTDSISPSGEKPRNDWYDAICDVWKYTGSMNGSMQKMLQGVATARGWKEYNLEQPLASSAELRMWAAWYRATQLNGNAKLNMLEKRDVIQSSIGYWQALQQPDAPAADDDDDLPVNNFDKMLEHLGL